MAEQTAIESPTNLYSILGVTPTSSSNQIREAYFCLRYDLSSKLDDDSNGGNKLSPFEKRKIQAKMDAVTGAFRVLTDPARRSSYDASLQDPAKRGELKVDTANGTSNNDESFKEKGITPRMNRSMFRRKAAPKNKPDKSEPVVGRGRPKAETVTSFHKRNVERSSASAKSDDKDDGSLSKKSAHSHDTRSQATSHINQEASTQEDTQMTNIQITEVTPFLPDTRERTYSKEEDSIFASTASKTNSRNSSTLDSIFDESKTSRSTLQTSNFVVTSHDESTDVNNTTNTSYYEEHLPLGVNNLNIREQMLYKNQMYLHSQTRQHYNTTSANTATGEPIKSRIATRYEAKERSDWLGNPDEEQSYSTGIEGEESTLEQSVDVTTLMEEESRASSKKKRWSRLLKKKTVATSPTGVEEMDLFTQQQPSGKVRSVASSSANSNNAKKSSYNMSSTKSHKSSNSRKTPSRFSFDDTSKASWYTEDTQDDTRTYDDDTTNCDDDTTNYDASTIGEFEETTVASTVNTVTTYDDDTHNSEGIKKYSPSHKRGNRPEPILKTSQRETNDNIGDRRVTVHSHRKHPAETSSCLPTLNDIKEEVSGTCKDAQSALHQVLHAFVISPDDIDRMSDRIRDAKLELTESYCRQVRERRRGEEEVGL